MYRLRQVIYNAVWNRSSNLSAASSISVTVEDDSGIELGLMEESGTDEIDDLSLLRKEYKDVPACQLCHKARKIVIKHLCRVHPVTGSPLTKLKEIKICFNGDKSKNYKFEYDHIKDLLDNWITVTHNRVGNLIDKIKFLRRRDILQDEKLIDLTGMFLYVCYTNAG